MKRKALDIIKRLPGIVAGLWLAFMGMIACFMLYNEIFDPAWGRQAKDRFPEPPEWYILAIVAMAAAFCFYLAYILIMPNRKRKQKAAPPEGEEIR